MTEADMATATTAKRLLTAEEYSRLPDDGRMTELVRGEVVEMNIPVSRHGEICARITYLLQRFLEDHPVGRVISNDSGVITERGKDTVRGPDVAFCSFARIPPGPLAWEYLSVPPEVVFEVRSPTDRWPAILTKTAEYLNAGVGAVCVVDQATMSVYVYRTDDNCAFPSDKELVLPELDAAFRIPVRRFFE
jgi:Uma2 family endonuclease